MVNFGALQMLGSSATPQWSAIGIDLVDARFWLSVVVMLLGGAFGGVSYELLLRGRVKRRSSAPDSYSGCTSGAQRSAGQSSCLTSERPRTERGTTALCRIESSTLR
jgi:hypothetical protein